MNDDERLAEYVRILQLVRSTIDDDSARLEEAFQEMQDARQQAAEASSRLRGVLTEHQAQTAANKAVNQETAKTNAQQDAVKHTDVMASALEDRLRKEIETRQRNQEKQKEALSRTNERLDASMDRFQQYAESFEGNDALAAKLKQFSDIFARLKALPRSVWDKKDLKDAQAAEKFAKELFEAAKNSTNQDEKGIAQAAMQAIKAWQDAIKKNGPSRKMIRNCAIWSALPRMWPICPASCTMARRRCWSWMTGWPGCAVRCWDAPVRSPTRSR